MVTDDAGAQTVETIEREAIQPPDSTPPNISFNPDTTVAGSYSRNWIFANYSASDNEAVNQVLSELGNTNQTVSNNASGNYWINHTGLSDGTYTLQGYAEDGAGNTAATAERTIILDTTPPTTSDNWTSDQYESQSSALVELTATDSTGVANISYRVDGGTYTTENSSSVTVSISGDGNHSLEYYAYDTEGNKESVNTEYVALDNTAPSISFNANATPSNDDYKKSWILNSITASDATSGAQTVRESFESTNSSFITASGSLYEENHTALSEDVTYKFYSWVRDGAGNYAQTSTRTVTVNQSWNDISFAGMNIDSPKNTSYSSTSVDLNVTAFENVSTWKRNLDDGGNQTFTPNTTLTNLSEGQHKLVLWANDTEGNYGRETVFFSVDTVAPNVSLIEPRNITYNSSSIPLNVTGSSDITNWIRQVDGGNTSFTPNTSFEPGNGQHTIRVYGSDAAGNTGKTSKVVFSVDAPTSGGGSGGGGSGGSGTTDDQPDQNVSNGTAPAWNVSSSHQQMIVDPGEKFSTALKFEIGEGSTSIRISCEDGDACNWLNDVPRTVEVSQSSNKVVVTGRAPGTVTSGKYDFDLVVEDTESGRKATLRHIVNSNKLLNQARKLIEVTELDPNTIPFVQRITDDDARSIPIPLAFPIFLVPALFFGVISLVERQFDDNYTVFKVGVSLMSFLVLIAVI